MSRAAQKSGASVEEMIEEQAAYSQHVIVVKQYPKVVYRSERGKKPRPQVEGNAWVDFIGFYKGHGFTFDAKANSDPDNSRNPANFPMKKDARNYRQLATMKDALRYAVPAFYLVYWHVYRMAEIFMVSEDSPERPRFTRGAGYWSSTAGMWLEAGIQAVFDG